MKLTAQYYQQFDADLSLDVPQEAFGGWQQTDIEINPERTALVLMHAWDCGTPEQYPGWFRCCPGILNTYRVCQDVLPGLLAAVRSSQLPLFHVVAPSRSEYYKNCPGYERALRLAGPPPPPPPAAEPDPVWQQLQQFRSQNVFVGERNRADVDTGWGRIAFPQGAEPVGAEGIAENAHQLSALARDANVNHLIYCGFNVDWCLLMSHGGMIDMSRRGFICSVLRDAVTAVENRETARQGLAKEIGLWRVSVDFGFVFEVPALVRALRNG